ncbi:radical SAM protein [Patescibacteria group bacterium]|nr:radical SAM protein [Patescibacteria group bacterium]
MKTPEKPDLKVYIVAPSQYERNGKLKRYWKTLMEPPALAVLGGLVEEAGQNLRISVAIENINERVERDEGYIKRIIQESRDRSSARKHLVMFSGKGFELSRLTDAQKELARAGVNTASGGPGISLADIETYKYLISHRLPFAVGEGENIVGQLIADTMDDRIKPCYWQRDFVDLRKAPFPKFPDKREHSRTLTHYVALGVNEGCPYQCGFCTVIEIRGRKMTPERSRNADKSIAWIEQVHNMGFKQIMITSDNLRRGYYYKEFKKSTIELNDRLKQEGEELHLLIQMDLEEGILNEIEDLAAMGVRNIFFGMESSDPLALDAEHKKQNDPSMYPVIAAKCRKFGITVSSGVMTCFPQQTPESIHKDMTRFNEFLDLPHLYAVTPLPQSPDWIEAVRKGELTTFDPNDYDSTRCIRDNFTKMTIREAQKAYENSFFDLFSWEAIMKRTGYSLKDRIQTGLYGRFLAEYGRRFGKGPWHIMMDGPPLLFGGETTLRPPDSFRGSRLDPKDPIYCSQKAFKEAKNKYLATIT